MRITGPRAAGAVCFSPSDALYVPRRVVKRLLSEITAIGLEAHDKATLPAACPAIIRAVMYLPASIFTCVLVCAFSTKTVHAAGENAWSYASYGRSEGSCEQLYV
jgi:hypothetical protein